MDFDKLEKSILSRITPSKADNEKIERIKNGLLDKIVLASNELGLRNTTPTVVGSVAKDTHLKKVDLDIFIMFPPETPRAELERLGLDIGYRVIPDATELYAEHPYLRGTVSEMVIDLVPCYDIKSSSDKMSAVDRSPFHTKYVQEKLPERLKGDVRLLKQFMKGIGGYGAEIKTQGFSGYLCEVLVIEFGSFHNVLEEINGWELPGRIIIIPESVKADFDHATISKFIEPLIIIDPVDVSRNVASPVSEETMMRVAKGVGSYLGEPNEKYFFPATQPVLDNEELKIGIGKTDGQVIGVELITEPIVPDVLYGQVRKSLNAVCTMLERREFSVKRSKFYVDEGSKGGEPTRIYILLLLDVFELPEKQVHRGPPSSHPNSESFLNKWKSSGEKLSEPYEKNGRWFVDIKREFRSALELVKAGFSELNHGRHLNESVKQGRYSILSDDELVDNVFRRHLSDFIFNKMPWEY